MPLCQRGYEVFQNDVTIQLNDGCSLNGYSRPWSLPKLWSTAAILRLSASRPQCPAGFAPTARFASAPAELINESLAEIFGSWCECLRSRSKYHRDQQHRVADGIAQQTGPESIANVSQIYR